MVVNHRVHVGNGGGYAIYINGRQLVEQPKCIGRGGGEKANGGFITADFLKEFESEEVTFAVISFLRYNDKYKALPTEKIPQGLISLHIDEQKLPPMGDDLVLKSATIVPMKTSEWEAMLAAGEEVQASNEVDPDSLRNRWDGSWKVNRELMGNWQVVSETNDPRTFQLPQKPNARNPFVSSLSLKDRGNTQETLLLWSGDHLLDLKRYEALKMEIHRMAEQDFLFVEAGGFRGRKNPNWKNLWLVFQRK